MENQERKAAYIEAVKENTLKIELLSRLHKKNKNIIEKWLYVPGRYPDFQACYELRLFLRSLRGKIPTSLSRIITRSTNRVSELIETMEKNPISNFEITGSRKQKGRSAAMIFLFNGQRMTMTEIAEQLGVPYHSVYGRIRYRGLMYEGADVSDVTERIKRRRA